MNFGKIVAKQLCFLVDQSRCRVEFAHRLCTGFLPIWSCRLSGAVKKARWGLCSPYWLRSMLDFEELFSIVLLIRSVRGRETKWLQLVQKSLFKSTDSLLLRPTSDDRQCFSPSPIVSTSHSIASVRSTGWPHKTGTAMFIWRPVLCNSPIEERQTHLKQVALLLAYPLFPATEASSWW